eukprot:5457839-Pyramimonas_sp.AAC.1
MSVCPQSCITVPTLKSAPPALWWAPRDDQWRSTCPKDTDAFEVLAGHWRRRAESSAVLSGDGTKGPDASPPGNAKLKRGWLRRARSAGLAG